jgi:hypothetical protein
MARLTPGQLRVTVTTAGTRVQITSSHIVTTNIIIQALSGNTGTVYVGNSSVSSSLCMVALAAGAAITLTPGAMGNDMGGLDLSEFYIDASQNSQSVNVGYTTMTPGLA